MHFSWYGFLIGLAATAFFLCFEKLLTFFAQEKKSNEDLLLLSKLSKRNLIFKILFYSLMSAMFGARLWHVLLNLRYYAVHLTQVWQTWRGGMSIIGALLFGLSTFYFLVRKNFPVLHKKVLQFCLDCFALSIPIAQIIGRVGNFINQELYGFPTKLPWGIFIQPADRVVGFEVFDKFHPLFLYEMILLSLFLLIIAFMFWSKPKKFTNFFGHGFLFIIYLMYYASIRFALDFLRIEKEMLQLSSFVLSFNQWALCLLVFSMSFYLFKKQILKKKFLKLALLGLNCIFILAIFLSGELVWQLQEKQQSTHQFLKAMPDHSLVQIQLANQFLTVEIVNTSASISQGLSGREQIGADGMLFILPNKQIPQFWMKGMKFDLDFVWINDDKVVEVMQDVLKPAQGILLLDLPRFSPQQFVEMVLEVKADEAWTENLDSTSLIRPVLLNP